MDGFYIVLAGLFILAVGLISVGIYLSTRSKQKGPTPREKSLSPTLDEDLRTAGVREIARLLRDEHSGALLLEKGGVIYRKADDLSPEQRELLLTAVGDLNTFLGSTSAPPLETGESASPTVSVTESDSAVPLSDRFKRAGQLSSDAQVKPPSMNPVDIFTRAITSDVSKVSSSAKSITAQIDEILQELIVQTPLEQRGIRLLDAPDGRVVVFVGIESYEGVDAVPDVEVRQAIRAAVAEWERRSSRKE